MEIGFHEIYCSICTPFPDKISSIVISIISSAQHVVGQPSGVEHLRFAGIDSAAAAPQEVSEGGVLHVFRPVMTQFSLKKRLKTTFSKPELLLGDCIALLRLFHVLVDD